MDKRNNMILNNINKQIKKQVNIDIINKLTDDNLLEDYLKCKSVNISINKLTSILKEVNIQENKIKEITTKYLLELIPPGTKGVIRGNKFNQLVKNYIIDLNMDTNIYEIKFETKHKDVKISEIPDWYIKNKKIIKL